jgi:DNA-binding NarL/FixJ family response regulator
LDAKTGEVTQRNFTTSELADLQVTNEQAEIEKAKQEAKLAARESALSKLAALGLTEEEIAAL